MMRGLKTKKAAAPSKAGTKGKGQPSLDDFLLKRDYTGALALLEFQLKCQDGDLKELLLWIGYAAFHLGNFRRAEEAYKELLETYDVSNEVYLNLACCYFYQQMYEEADKAAMKGPPDSLQNRLLFNTSHRMGDESKLMQFHQNLKDKKEGTIHLTCSFNTSLLSHPFHRILSAHLLIHHINTTTNLIQCIHSTMFCRSIISCSSTLFTIPSPRSDRHLQAIAVRKSRRLSVECIRR